MSSWHNVKTIAKRELSGYFVSPVAYVFIVIFLLLAGFFTFMAGGFFRRGDQYGAGYADGGAAAAGPRPFADAALWRP